MLERVWLLVKEHEDLLMSIVQRVMDNGSETIRGLKSVRKRRREKQCRVIKLSSGDIYFVKARARYMDISQVGIVEIVNMGLAGTKCWQN